MKLPRVFLRLPIWAWGMVLAWGAGLGTVGVVALGVVFTGAFNTTASTPHPPLIAWATHLTMTNAVKRGAGRMPAPPRLSQADVLAGARLYDTNCAMCHGGPGLGRAAWVSGLTPAPPYLLDAARTWTPNELFWIVRYGVRMTAMPAWDRTMSEHDVWDVVAFLDALPDLSVADYARMRSAQAPAPTAVP